MQETTNSVVERWTSRKLWIWAAMVVLFTTLFVKGVLSEDAYVSLIEPLIWAFFLANAGIASARALSKK